MTPSCLKRVCEMFTRDRLLTGPLYTARTTPSSDRAEVLVWEPSIRCDPILRQWNGNVAIERALLDGLRALQAQGRVVRSESLSPAGTAQSWACWRLCAAPGATT